MENYQDFLKYDQAVARYKGWQSEGSLTDRPFGVNELREAFLAFFESKGHLRMKSFSLVPHNDKSLLLINSGMAPLKPYFTGQANPTGMGLFLRCWAIFLLGITLRRKPSTGPGSF